MKEIVSFRRAGTGSRFSGTGTCLVFALLSGLLFICMAPAVGADDYSDEILNQIEGERFKEQTARKSFVDGNMDLTPEESSKFWPLYYEYTSEIFSLDDKLAELLAQYAAGYTNKSLSDEQAGKMLKNYLQYEKQYAKIRLKYSKKFGEILPPKKVMRFFQIENKLNALVEMEMARQIPLAE